MPAEPRPLEPRSKEGAADVASLVALGLEEPPPIPTPSIQPFLAPDLPPPDEED
ncbi:hypothetical protein OG342_06805 [Streptomyces bobili]|uniref:hypothetical protein n=1 Tax=Streptomyces bobili TaxID=67280 RepID=UPI00224D47FD|nr:hypothetical protein [Streptomyces bobili]MCX5522572.1 hypothetical protein [Streptomyces bobili]